MGIGAAQGSEGEAQADSAAGLSPPVPSGRARPVRCDRLPLPRRESRDTSPAAQRSGGDSPGAGSWLPTSGRISPRGASRHL